MQLKFGCNLKQLPSFYKRITFTKVKLKIKMFHEKVVCNASKLVSCLAYFSPLNMDAPPKRRLTLN
jgi:hypothetical protein